MSQDVTSQNTTDHDQTAVYLNLAKTLVGSYRTNARQFDALSDWYGKHGNDADTAELLRIASHHVQQAADALARIQPATRR